MNGRHLAVLTLSDRNADTADALTAGKRPGTGTPVGNFGKELLVDVMSQQKNQAFSMLNC